MKFYHFRKHKTPDGYELDPELVSHYTQLIVALKVCIEDMTCELVLRKK